MGSSSKSMIPSNSSSVTSSFIQSFMSSSGWHSYEMAVFRGTLHELFSCTLWSLEGQETQFLLTVPSLSFVISISLICNLASRTSGIEKYMKGSCFSIFSKSLALTRLRSISLLGSLGAAGCILMFCLVPIRLVLSIIWGHSSFEEHSCLKI